MLSLSQIAVAPEACCLLAVDAALPHHLEPVSSEEEDDVDSHAGQQNEDPEGDLVRRVVALDR